MILPTKTVKNSRAFTLLELVIVVVILGIIYSMVTINAGNSTKTVTKLDSTNLRDFMRSQNNGKERSFYLYGEECENAAFIPALDQGIQIDQMLFDKKISAYWLDHYGALKERTFTPLKIEDKSYPVCLKFDLFANGSSSALVIRDGQKFYYSPFFEKSRHFDSLQEAESFLKHQDINPDYLGVKP